METYLNKLKKISTYFEQLMKHHVVLHIREKFNTICNNTATRMIINRSVSNVDFD